MQSDQQPTNAPSVPDSGSDGSQSRAMDGEVLAPTTETTFPKDQFISALGAITDEGARGYPSRDASKLILAKMQEDRSARSDLEDRLKLITDQRDEARSFLAETKTELAVERQKSKGYNTIQVVFSICLFAAAALLSFTIPNLSQPLIKFDYALLLIAGCLYLLGSFGPLLVMWKGR